MIHLIYRGKDVHGLYEYIRTHPYYIYNTYLITPRSSIISLALSFPAVTSIVNL